MKKFHSYRHVRVVCAIMTLSMGTPAFAGEPNGLRFGSVAMDIPAVMYHRLSPLTDYLSKTLKRPVTLSLSPNMSQAIDELATGKVDIAYLTPVAYLKAHDQGGAQLVVKMVTENKAFFNLDIVVREDSPIKQVSDLRGKRFAFGDKAALLQRAVVVGAGVPLADLGEYQFIGHYDNIARAVMSRDFDAGILKDTTTEKWVGKGLRILHRSPNLPPYNIAVSAKVDKELLAQLRAAFLQLKADSPDHRAVLMALDPQYDGFAATNDKEYDLVRKLIAPF